jgi:hypothetical protein
MNTARLPLTEIVRVGPPTIREYLAEAAVAYHTGDDKAGERWNRIARMRGWQDRA